MAGAGGEEDAVEEAGDLAEGGDGGMLIDEGVRGQRVLTRRQQRGRPEKRPVPARVSSSSKLQHSSLVRSHNTHTHPRLRVQEFHEAIV